MSFRKLVEQTVLPPHAPEKVLLFHGTSAAKLGKILSEGLAPPKGTILDYLESTARDYATSWGHPLPAELPKFFREKFDFYVYSVRHGFSAVNLEQDRCIYMSPSLETAAVYANKVGKGGSEAHQYAYEKCAEYGRSQRWFQADPPQPRFSDSTGVVIAASVHVADTSIDNVRWASTYRIYLEMVGKGVVPEGACYQTWARVEGYMSLPSNEVRVYADISPGDILVVNDRDGGVEKEVHLVLGVLGV